MKALRKPIFIVLAVLMLGILAGGGYIAYFYLAHTPIKFSSEGWKQGDALTRGRMLKDLRESGILIGKTKQQVTDLLGPPDTEAKDANAMFDMERRIPYRCSYLVKRYYTLLYAEWDETLNLNFDENGICTGFYIVD
jgi:hypothetical protein